MKRILLTLILLTGYLHLSPTYGQIGSIGPGGVGDEDTSPFVWYDYFGLKYPSATGNWLNVNGTDSLDVISGSNKPTITTISGKKALLFDASNTESVAESALRNEFHEGTFHVFLTFRISDRSTEQGLITFDSTDCAFGVSVTDSGRVMFQSLYGGSSTDSVLVGDTGTIQQDEFYVLSFKATVDEGGPSVTVDNVRINGTEELMAGSITIGSDYDLEQFTLGVKNTDAAVYLEGYIGELAIYTETLNDLQVDLIENGLGYHHLVSLDNDLHGNEVGHEFQVAGIGINGSDEHLTATSRVLEISENNTTPFVSGEYLTLGHDKSSANSDEYSGEGGINVKTMNRIWRVNLTSSSPYKLIDVAIDTHNLYPKEDFQDFVLLVSSNQDWSDIGDRLEFEFSVPDANGIATVSGVRVEDGDYISIGVQNVNECFDNYHGDQSAIGRIDGQFNQDSAFCSGYFEFKKNSSTTFADNELLLFANSSNGSPSPSFNESSDESPDFIHMLSERWCGEFRTQENEKLFDFRFHGSNQLTTSYQMDIPTSDYVSFVLLVSDYWDMTDAKVYLMDKASYHSDTCYEVTGVEMHPGRQYLNWGYILPDSYVPEVADAATGTVLQRKYSSGSTINVAELRTEMNFPLSPDSTGYYTKAESDPNDNGDNFGRYLQGYLYPQDTGSYTFYIKSDDASEFWLSTGTNPENISLKAYSPASSTTYSDFSQQTSSAINLDSGAVYYFEVLMKEAGGGDAVHLKWKKPDTSENDPIPATYISPWTQVATLAMDDLYTADTTGYTGIYDEFVLTVDMDSAAMSPGDFMFVHFDGNNYDSLTYDNHPTENFSRMKGEWFARVSTRDASGTLTADFTLSGDSIPSKSAGEEYLLLIDSDGDYDAGVLTYLLESNGDGNYTASDVPVSDSSYISLGVTTFECYTYDKKIIGFGKSTGSYAEVDGDELTLTQTSEAYTSSPIGPGNYATLSNNNGNNNSLVSTEARENSVRAAREWCIRMHSSNEERIGISIADNDFPSSPSINSDYQYRAVFLDSDGDGDFTTGDPYVIVLNDSSVSNTWEIGEVPLSDSQYVCLGYLHDFEFDGSYGNHIASIGKAWMNYEETTDTSNIVSLSVPSSLDIDDYMIIGHNGSSTTVTSSTNTPDASNITRMNRIWRVDHYNNIGTIDVSYNNATDPGSDYYVLLVDEDDTDFSDATVYSMFETSDEYFTVHDITLPDSAFFTIGKGTLSTTNAQLLTYTFLESNTELTDGDSITLYLDPNDNMVYQNPCPRTTDEANITIHFTTGDEYNWGQNEFDSEVTVDITAFDAFSGGDTVFSKQGVTLTLDEHNVEQLYSYDFTSDLDEVKTIYVDITGFTHSVSDATNKIDEYLQLKATIELDQRVSVPLTHHSFLSISDTASGTNRIHFEWNDNYCDAPYYELQLLKLYNKDTAKLASDAIITAEVDWSRALSMITETNETDLTMVEGTGYYVWRVRPIGDYYGGTISDARNFGAWTNAPEQGEELSLTTSVGNEMFYFNQFDEEKNFIYSRTFTEGGRVGEAMTYADGLQRVKQTQTYISSNDTMNIIATGTVYDYSGRPAIQSLPAPIGGVSQFGFIDTLLQKGSDIYTAADFDTDDNYDNSSGNEIDVDNGPVFDYYSNNNPDARIPNAEGYAFTRTLYHGDGSGRTDVVSGVGVEHSIGHHTVNFRYATASDAELIRVLGDEAPAGASVIKQFTTDENYITTVNYVNNAGQTIITSIAENDSTSNLTELPSVDSADFSVTDYLPASTIDRERMRMFSSRSVQFTEATQLTIGYDITPNTIEDVCDKYCATCGYDIKILVHNADYPDSLRMYVGSIAAGSLTESTCTTSEQTPTVYEDGLGDSVSTSFPIVLNLSSGKYVVEKYVSLSDADRQEVIDSARSKIESDLDAIMSPVYTRLDWVQDETITLSGFFTYLEDTLQVNAISSNDYDLVIYDIDTTTSTRTELFNSATDGIGDTVGTISGSYELKIVTGCCEIDISLIEPEPDPCSVYDPEDMSPDYPDFETPLVQAYFGDDYSTQNITNITSFSSAYTYPVDSFNLVVETMLQAQDTNGNDLYTCQSLWQCALSNMMGKQAIDEIDTIDVAEMVNDGLEENASQLPDWSPTSVSSADSDVVFLENFLNCSGRNYRGVTEDDWLLKYKPYFYIHYDSSWAQTSPDTNIYQLCEDAFCNLAQIDLSDSTVMELPDTAAAGYNDPCQVPMCSYTWTGETDDHDSEDYLTIARDTIDWGHMEYWSLEQCVKWGDLSGNVTQDDIVDDAQDQADQMENECRSACSERYEDFLNALVALYDPDDNGSYYDEDGNSMAFEDICCTAESMVEDCRNRCSFTLQWVGCSGGDSVLVSIGNQDELEYLHNVQYGSFDATLKSTGAQINEPSRTTEALVALLDELIAGQIADGATNDLALNTEYNFRSYQAYGDYKDIFLNYNTISIANDGEITLSNYGSNGHSFDFLMDDILATETLSELEGIDSLVLHASDTTKITVSLLLLDGTYSNYHQGPEIYFTADDTAATVYSEYVADDTVRSGYYYIEPDTGGVNAPPYCMDPADDSVYVDYITLAPGWDQSLGGTATDDFQYVMCDNDGNIIVLANSESDTNEVKSEFAISKDVWVVKLNGEGNIIWENSVIGEDDDYGNLSNIIQNKRGNYVTVVHSSSDSLYDKTEDISVPNGTEFWFVELDKDSGHVTRDNTIESIYGEAHPSIIESQFGGYWLGALSNSPSGYDKTSDYSGFGNDYWLIRLDNEGEVLWDSSFGGAGSGTCLFYDLIETIDGDVVMMGTSNAGKGNQKTNDPETPGDMEIWLIKVDRNGNKIWDRSINQSGETVLDLVPSKDNGMYLIGGVSSGTNMFVSKLDENGTVVWADTSDGGFYGFSAIENEDGTLVVSGGSNVNINADKQDPLNGLDDYWVVIYNEKGEIVLDESVGGLSSETYPIVITKTPDNNYVVGGNTNSSPSGEKTDTLYGSADTWLVQIIQTPSCTPDTVGLKWYPPASTGTTVVYDPPRNSDVDSEYAQDIRRQIELSVNRCLLNTELMVGDAYVSHCMADSTLLDTLSLDYDLRYHHYTLYYYDRAGQLWQTVPPAGVDILDLTANGVMEREVSPNHSLNTTYKYNTYGQLISQTTPDGGETKFIYDGKGLLRFREDARQRSASTPRFSYTKYDALGRTIEVGESSWVPFDSLENYSSSFLPGNFDEYGPESFPLDTHSLNDRVVTIYNTNSGVTFLDNSPQRFLENRISYVFNDEDGQDNTLEDRIHTYYSYDPHGNVEWMIQDIPGLGRNYIAYTYDLISGNVKQVAFNEGLDDQLYHKYTYDTDNRITTVQTSRDGKIWDADARYEYYAHGPLSRTTLGEDQVQGIDYLYTTQGWLKAINYQELDTVNDPGLDGIHTSNVGRDAFGMMLTYYDGDFNRTGSPFNTSASASLVSNKSLYNGNISSWTSQIEDHAGTDYAYLSGRTFEYDYLNRIVASNFKTWDSTNVEWDDPTNSDFSTTYSYDGNGNLQTLKRYAKGSIGTGSPANLMDNLVYHYMSGTNKLEWVDDSVTTSGISTDLEDQSAGNYTYDSIGNLIGDNAETIDTIIWHVNGKVRQVIRSSGDTITFTYDPLGNRIKKDVIMSGIQTLTYYVRDAQGNVMSIYETTENTNGTLDYRLADQPIYGSSRVGSLQSNDEINKSESEIAVTDLVITEVVHDTKRYNGSSDYGETFGNFVCIRNVTEKAISLEDVTIKCQRLGGSGITRYQDLDEVGYLFPGEYLIVARDTTGGSDYEPPSCGSTDIIDKFLEINNLPSDLLDDDKVKFLWGDSLELNFNTGLISIRQYLPNGSSSYIDGARWSRYSPSSYIPALNSYDSSPCDTPAVQQSLHRIKYHSTNTSYKVANWEAGDCSIYSDAFEYNGFEPEVLTKRTRVLGEKNYELNDHLGNVRVVVTDRKFSDIVDSLPANYTADIVSLYNYYPFGMNMPGRNSSPGNYRFGFQGQEGDPEIKGEGNSVNYTYRMHDPRVGRFLSRDPLAAKYPYNSPYAFSENRVIDGVELEGLEFVDADGNYHSLIAESSMRREQEESPILTGIRDGFISAGEFICDKVWTAEFWSDTWEGIKNIPSYMADRLSKTDWENFHDDMDAVKDWWNNTSTYEKTKGITEFTVGSLIIEGAGTAPYLGKSSNYVITKSMSLTERIGVRKGLATEFYKKAGFSEASAAQHMRGINFEKGVQTTTLKKGTVVQQWVGESGVGNYFTTLDNGVSRNLGISYEGRTLKQFTLTEDVKVLKSTAADFQGQVGGGTQYFSTDLKNKVKVKDN